MSSGRRRHVVPVALLSAAVVLVLSACGGSDTTATGSPASGSAASGAAATPTPGESGMPSASGAAEPTVAAATGPKRSTKVGVTVTGDFGQKPALTIPSGAAPTTLQVEQLVAGTGDTVAKGQTLVANYLGQTWTPKDGQANIFDNSYDTKAPAAFQIGTGKVIPGWDSGLVGRRIGSRLLLSIPPAEAYGPTPSTDNELSGQHLVFVVDIVDAIDARAGASGTVVGTVPAGYPTVTSAPGKEPAITSVKGVTAGAEGRSTLLIKGDGPAIDATKSLALQFIQTDTATGKQTQSTWGKGVEVVPAEQVFAVASALKGARVGSRAVVVTAAATGQDSLVVVVDVVAQF